MASFRKALQAGATGLEFDIRRCGDGRLVVIHDDTVDRTTTGRGRVRDLHHDELRLLDAGSGECIPLLTDVLDEFGRRCLLNIEMKDDGLASDVERLVRERDLQRDVIVAAFHWEELRAFSPEIPIALLSSTLHNMISTAQQFGARAIQPRHDRVTKGLVTAAHAEQLQVYVWTVNDIDQAARLRDMGVDGIITDVPEQLATLPL